MVDEELRVKYDLYPLVFPRNSVTYILRDLDSKSY